MTARCWRCGQPYQHNFLRSIFRQGFAPSMLCENCRAGFYEWWKSAPREDSQASKL